MLHRLGLNRSRGRVRCSTIRGRNTFRGRVCSMIAAAFLLNLFLRSLSRLQSHVLDLNEFSTSKRNGASGDARRHPAAASILSGTNETRSFYLDNKEAYHTKADFDADKRLFAHFKRLDMCGKEFVVLVGGTNEGQLSTKILSWCPDLTFYGFEIQHEPFLKARNALANFSKALMLNMGWSEEARENVPISGKNTLAGLYAPGGRWKLQKGKVVNTIPLADFAIEQNISSVLYTVIDTEGHEPKVIRGMKLDDAENRKRFPLFQFELGGTWGARDVRHGNDPWNQQVAVKTLRDWGYLTFLVGSKDWLPVGSDFFDEKENAAAMKNEGLGPFIVGNLLAMHKDFTPPRLKELILDDCHGFG
ncbi:hypothetical protein ACHAWF_004828 [Thalassiosira exigua]